MKHSVTETGVDERQILLESKVAFQEVALERLQKLFEEQQVTLERLEKQLKVLKQRVDSGIAGEGHVGPADQKPPHY